MWCSLPSVHERLWPCLDHFFRWESRRIIESFLSLLIISYSMQQITRNLYLLNYWLLFLASVHIETDHVIEIIYRINANTRRGRFCLENRRRRKRLRDRRKREACSRSGAVQIRYIIQLRICINSNCTTVWACLWIKLDRETMYATYYINEHRMERSKRFRQLG